MVNDKFNDKEYWEGIRDACEYFRDELGIEDAMDTNIAIQAEAELELAWHPVIIAAHRSILTFTKKS